VALLLLSWQYELPRAVAAAATWTRTSWTLSVVGEVRPAVAAAPLPAAARARAAGAVTVAVTNSPGSPLAAAAEHHLDVLAGPERAVAATAHKLARIIYHLLKEHQPYAQLDAEVYEQQQRERAVRQLEQRAARLGFTLAPQPA
jgi:glucosamine 6-phosphate synthetase-like amidotransferase/phosphosugar isomerase protein